jgi:5-hydroxytryptamine receptor 2
MNQMSNCSKIFDNLQINGENVICNSFENDSFLTNNSFIQSYNYFDEFLVNSNESINVNISENFNDDIINESPYKWIYLVVILFVICGGLGNILVCLSVALDKNLQNVTNYFLFSLAVADLLVSLFVMPLSAIPAFLGKFKSSFLLYFLLSRSKMNEMKSFHFNVI